MGAILLVAGVQVVPVKAEPASKIDNQIVQQLNPQTILPVRQADFPDRSKLVAKQRAEAEAERARLEAERVAREAAALAAQQAAQPAVSFQPAQPSGNCQSWMAAAGITDQASAYQLIMRESGCNPNARNASSGACGIGQQLPCGKWAHAWNDPVGGMIDMQNYVFGRYGTWANALGHSLANNWY